MVVFYEKTGCITNRRQKRLLLKAGYDVDVRDLRHVAWDHAELGSFFEGLPVQHCFNTAAPQVKSGEVNPSAYTKEEAIALMIETPLLIRRPLLSTDKGRGCGFEGETLARLGLEKADPVIGKEGCSNSAGHVCQDPERGTIKRQGANRWQRQK